MMPKRTVWLWFPLILMLAPTWAEDFSGTVIAVHDGDTVTVLTPNRRQIRVRLAEIDTPESNQPYGERAKEALTALVFGDKVRVVVQARDDYGRLVGRIYIGSMDVNAELVRRGAAWVYRHYATDQTLFDLQAEARAYHRGLWVLPQAQQTPPWQWRRMAAATATPPATPATARTCAVKKFCRDMTRCDEALFYLQQCGLRHLDKDNDGVPCETLCR